MATCHFLLLEFSLCSVNRLVVQVFILYDYLILITSSCCSLARILRVLEVVAPFKHFNKLKEFVAMKLPPGFPVRIGQVIYLCVGFIANDAAERKRESGEAAAL